jgi:hypothetical protein
MKTILLATVLATGGALAADWSLLECPRADQTLQQRLRTVERLETFESPTPGWQVHQGGQSAQVKLTVVQEEHQAGQSSLQVDYAFTGKTGLEYVAIGRSLALPTNTTALAYWVKRAGTSLPLALRLEDRSGEIHQFEVEEDPGEGWLLAAAQLRNGNAWGGDGNRRLDPPVKLNALVFDREKTGFKGTGRLWVDEVQTATAPPQDKTAQLRVEVTGKRFGNVYEPGETLEARATAAEGQVGWRLLNTHGQELARQAPGGTSATASHRLTQPGYYLLAFDCVKNGRVVETRELHAAALATWTDPIRNAFLGFCTHYGQSSYPLESMDLLKRYGFRRFRDEVSWSSVEREKGRYALPSHATRFLEHARSLEMEPLLIFDYANKLYDDGAFPNTPETIAAFGRYAAELARLTTGTVKEFEIWNEWIGGCGMQGRPGDHGGEAYGRLMAGTYPPVKATRPDATIVGIGGEYGHDCASNIVKSVRTGGTNNLDAYSIHPYRYPHSPEASDLVGEVRGIFNQVTAAGAPPRQWITEIGYPTQLGRRGSTLAQQARHTVRTLALLQGSGLAEKVYWYDFKDDGLDRNYNENNFGLVHHQQHNCAPKPAAVAAAVYHRLTAGAKPMQLTTGTGLNSLLFRCPDGTDLLLLWCAKGETTVTLSGTRQAGFDLVGTPLAGKFSGLITEDPIYLKGRNLAVTPR